MIFAMTDFLSFYFVARAKCTSEFVFVTRVCKQSMTGEFVFVAYYVINA